MEVWFSTLLILFVIGSMTATANYGERFPGFRKLLIVSILMLNFLMCFYPALALVSPDAEDISSTNRIGAFVSGFATAALASLFLLYPVRRYLARFLPKAPARPTTVANHGLPVPMMNTLDNGIVVMEAVDPKQRIISGGSHAWRQAQLDTGSGFRPNSVIHMWAGVIVIYFVGLQLMTLFLADGLEGLAEDIGVSYSTLIANFLPMVIIPLMGVGLFMRRDLRQSLFRLGIKPLNLEGLAKSLFVSGAATFGLVIWAMVVGAIWQGVVSPETFEEQSEASNALADSITTLGLAFVVAFTAGVGEEIAFRGAMQPVFGFWFTTFIFVAAHTQYALTPAWLIILVVALAFALLRKHFDTTTAILTHFFYDFTLLILLLVSKEISWLTIPM